MRLLRSVVIPVLLVVIGGVVGYRLGNGSFPSLMSAPSTINQLKRITNAQVPPDKSEINFAQFWEVWQRLEKLYVDPDKVNGKKMFYGAIQGMVAALGDPYTVYLPPTEQKRSSEDLQGSFGGVGIQLGFKDNILAVMSPLKNNPADKAGIKAGDYILRIRDADNKVDRTTNGMPIQEAVDIIRGKIGTKVTLTIKHEQDEPRDVELVRDTIVVPTIELKYVEKNGKRYAHLILSKFGAKTEKELTDAVQQIASQKKSLGGVVLDLRNDTGGYLDTAIYVASEFIPEGVVVTQQGRAYKQDFKVDHKGSLTDVPVVVLINKGSASASEIVAGALRDRLKAKLVGENSFGKGTVQDAQDDLPDGAGLHITIAKWLLPSGAWIHEKGLAPDIAVKDDDKTPDVDEVLQAGIDALK